MSFKRSQYDKRKNKQLAIKTPNVCGFSGGSYFDENKNRYIRVYSTGERRELSHRFNRKLRQSSKNSYQF